MNPIAENYIALVQQCPPKVIRNKEENNFWLAKLAELNSRWRRLRPEEKELYDTLVILVEEFERRTYQFGTASPLEVLQELLRANELRQKDLVPSVFESESVASEVLNKKRALTIHHVKRLCARFGLPASLFIQPQKG